VVEEFEEVLGAEVICEGTVENEVEEIQLQDLDKAPPKL